MSNQYWEYCSYLQFLANPQHSVRSILWINSSPWDLWFYTNAWVTMLIKLQALPRVTLLTYSNYIIKYITSILLLIFWHYLLAAIANFWKLLTHLKRYVPVPLEQSCLLLLNLEMSITIGNSSFIWKYKKYLKTMCLQIKSFWKA